MSLTRRVAHNTLIQIVGKILAIAMGIAVIGMMTRYLGPEQYGYYATIVAYLQIVGIAMDLGLTLTTLQLLATPGTDTKRITQAAIGLRLAVAIPLLVLAVIVGSFFPYPAIVKWGMALLAIEMLASSCIQLATTFFQWKLQMIAVVVADLVGRAVLLVGVVIATRFDTGFLSILWSIVAGSATVFIILFAAAQRFTSIVPRFDPVLWKKFIITSWPLALSAGLNLLYLKGDTFILSLTRTPEEVGLYAAPYRALEILASIPFMFVGIAFPLLRTAWLSDRERFARMIQKSFDALMLFALPMVGGTLMLGERIMTLIAGPAFAPSGRFLQLLIIASGFIFIGTLFGHVIVVINKQRMMIWGYAATATVALIGYILFIPRWGGWGAAVMTIVAEGMITIITMTVTRKVTGIKISLRTTGKAAIATLLMMMLLVSFAHIHVLLLIGIGAIIYGALLLVLRAVPHALIQEILP
ncbi:flippase [Candidatus Uhrbacteria bacterium]|nr:flippase [Candidatus Uhrbacteria bacterium]